ncbi:hypothetical protein ACIOUE_08965 [Streptomyces xanthochromogenes]|uniref:hypothetical protein n=1 Tax=Streptomyces xanthochromogenes TaxID=67384 RepID=UPI0038128ED9
MILVACRPEKREDDEKGRSAPRELVDLDSRIVDYARKAADRKPYTPPSDEERKQIAQGVGHLLDGDAARAEELFATAGFHLSRLTDAASGRRYDEVAARKPGPRERWGRLYVNADAEVRWSVQVPHPVSDSGTEHLGARLLEETPRGALVLAGAHRTAGRGDAADVAHRTDSVFHAVVAEMHKRAIPGVQLHGFAKGRDRPYDAILSTGAARSATGSATRLADFMKDRDLRVCRSWSDRCPLEGTTNVQGEDAKKRSGTFVHAELSPSARNEGNEGSEGKQAQARSALRELLVGWSENAPR